MWYMNLKAYLLRVKVWRKHSEENDLVWKKEKYQHLKSAFFRCWLNFSEIMIHWIKWFWRKLWPSVRVNAEEPRWSDASGMLDVVWVTLDFRNQREGVYLYHLTVLMEYTWISQLSCMRWWRSGECHKVL